MSLQWQTNFIFFTYPIDEVCVPGDLLTIQFDYTLCSIVPEIAYTMNGVPELLEWMHGKEIKVEFVQYSRIDPSVAIVMPSMRDIKLRNLLC